jgi:hypothetical protein
MVVVGIRMKKILDSDWFVLLLAEKPFLRRLFFDFWFRMAFLAFIFLAIFLALSLPRIWLTTPSGFKPVIRISALDWVQSRSLRRSAMKAAQSGRLTEAEYAWRAAVVHAPASQSLVREFLAFYQIVPPTPKRMPVVLSYSAWLLQLSKTNLADATLVATIYDRYRLHDQVINLLEPRIDQMSGEAQSCYLKALFNQGQISLFIERWNKLQPNIPSDPELPLYHAAFLAGWGPTDTRVEACKQLQDLKADAKLGAIANRLLLAVYARLRDADEYLKALTRLETSKADTLTEHVGYWYLLASLSQTNKAVELATAFPVEPSTGMEMVRLADVYMFLGLKTQALQLLEKFVPQFDNLPGWLTYVRLLIDLERWDDLRAAALQMRTASAARDQVADYTFFLEGRADLEQGKRGSAEIAFEKAAQFEFINPTLGLAAANDLVRLGYPAYAKQILNHLEKAGGNNPQYWLLTARAAYELKQYDILLNAAQKAYALNPRGPLIRNYYAASLLIGRQKPAEAIRLTLELLAESPQVVGFRLNHVLALLLNERPTEAQTLLTPIRPEILNEEELNAYYLARFELDLQLMRWTDARTCFNKINRQHLFALQTAWLDNQLKLLDQQSPARP